MFGAPVGLVGNVVSGNADHRPVFIAWFQEVPKVPFVPLCLTGSHMPVLGRRGAEFGDTSRPAVLLRSVYSPSPLPVQALGMDAKENCHAVADALCHHLRHRPDVARRLERDDRRRAPAEAHRVSHRRTAAPGGRRGGTGGSHSRPRRFPPGIHPALSASAVPAVAGRKALPRLVCPPV